MNSLSRLKDAKFNSGAGEGLEILLRLYSIHADRLDSPRRGVASFAFSSSTGTVASGNLEEALANSDAEAATTLARLPEPKRLSHEEFQASLDRMAQFSEKIPPMPGETFSREMIYQDHDFKIIFSTASGTPAFARRVAHVRRKSCAWKSCTFDSIRVL